MKIKDLKPARHNPRKITDKKLEMLKKSMKEFGDLSGIVFNVRTKRLIGGHQRIKHLDPSWGIVKKPHKDKVGTVAIGHIETPQGRWQYREVNWTEKKELAANVATNAHGGEFDYPKLKDIIVEIDDGSMDMALTGFQDDEIKALFDFEMPKDKDDIDGDGLEYETKYEIVVQCVDEKSQEKIYKMMTEKGYKCRILTL